MIPFKNVENLGMASLLYLKNYSLLYGTIFAFYYKVDYGDRLYFRTFFTLFNRIK